MGSAEPFGVIEHIEVFERIITCPRCSGGVTTVDEDDKPVRYSTGNGALDVAEILLEPGEKIGECPTCKGAKLVNARIEVPRG